MALGTCPLPERQRNTVWEAGEPTQHHPGPATRGSSSAVRAVQHFSTLIPFLVPLLNFLVHMTLFYLLPCIYLDLK